MLVDCFVPKAARYYRREVKPRYPRTLRKCATTKRKLWKRLKKQPYDTVLRERYRRCVYPWRKLLADSQTIFEENLITANNTGAFYRYVNRRITSHSSVGFIVDHNGAHLPDNALKLNAFNNFFVSVGTPDNNVIPECHEDTLLTSILEYIVVDAADVGLMSSID